MNQGFIQLILLLVVAVIVVSLFGVSLRDTLGGETGRDNFKYAWEIVQSAWNDYLKVPFIWVWKYIINPFIIAPIEHFIDTEDPLVPQV